MKRLIWLLPAMLAVTVPAASANEMCSRNYVGCMDKCGTMGSTSAADRCINSCQGETNRCTADAFSRPLPAQLPPEANTEAANADEAAKPKAAAARKRNAGKNEPRAQAKPAKREQKKRDAR